MKRGDRFGRLTLLEPAGNELCGNIRWKVRCDCGVVFEVAGNNLRNGHTRSCGCLRAEILRTSAGRHTKRIAL